MPYGLGGCGCGHTNSCEWCEDCRKNDMQQTLEEPKMTIGRALDNLEQCLQLTESLVNGNPVNEQRMAVGTIASAPLIRYREHIEELTKRLAEINQKLTIL